MKPPRARASVSFASITATILFTVSPLYQGDPTVPNRLRFCRGPQQPRPLIQRRRQWLVLWQRFLDVHGTRRCYAALHKSISYFLTGRAAPRVRLRRGRVRRSAHASHRVARRTPDADAHDETRVALPVRTRRRLGRAIYPCVHHDEPSISSSWITRSPGSGSLRSFVRKATQPYSAAVAS